LDAAFHRRKNKSKRQKKNLDKLRAILFDGSKANNLQKVETRSQARPQIRLFPFSIRPFAKDFLNL
jgi:hypothetical protein